MVPLLYILREVIKFGVIMMLYNIQFVNISQCIRSVILVLLVTP